MIGGDDDSESLQDYSNQFMNIFVNNQLVFFSNDQRMIDAFIIQAGDLFDIVTINMEIPFLRCQWFKFLLYFLNMMMFLRN